MSNTDSSRTFNANLLRLSLRSGIMPALAISLLAGSAGAQDSSGFGLLAALKSQAKQQTETAPADESNEMEDNFGSGSDFEEGFESSEPNDSNLEDFGGAVDVSDYDLVDLHVNNEDLGNILQLLSIQSSRNIISSNNVSATVTADLYGVTFYEALDSILHVNGYGYIEKGNFIYVYTAEELAEFEALSRKPVTKIITLDYLNATDAGEFAKMLLSDNGSITTNAQTEPFSITNGVPTGADNYANSATIVVHDYEENVDEIMTLIANLDTKPAQILVEATILQTTLNEANAFGMDFALIQNLDFTDFVGTGGPLSIVDGLISGAGKTVDGTNVNAVGPGGHGTGLSSTVGNTAGAAGLKAGFVNGDVGVFMRVLDEVTDVTVVSNPKLLTLNRQPARVLVGTRVGYLNSTTTNTSTTQSVEFLNVGTQLSVRPFVGKNGLIRLELRPQVSNFTLRQVSDGAGNIVTIPDEDTTEMNTNVMVRDGQTVVLGGLFTETTSTTRRQVPVLGDIPLIGSAFKGFDDETRRSEIIFLITPSIINDTVLTETGDMGNQYIEHARYGARKGLLPWSRERRVGQLLISARQLADDGQVQEALGKVDRALRLMPASPDARVLRTELTSEYRTTPSRSLINGMLHKELHSSSTPNFNTANVIDPFQAPVGTGSDFDSVASDSSTPEFIEFDPSSTQDFEPSPSFDSESIVEVDVDTVSDASHDFESPIDDDFFTEKVESSEFTEVALGESEFGESNFDQMKSVVTGEQTSVDLAQAGSTTPWALDPDANCGLDSDSGSFSVAAEKFGGQLIIPMPNGGALHLNWPLDFDYVASKAPEASYESEAVFTEVPVTGDDFADFSK